ncbi:MAG: hypothetical protein ACJ77K_06690 [Bacteroidia bacterium]
MSYQHQTLGAIVASVLNYDQFCNAMGEKPAINNANSSYVPCDGRLITGSALEKLTQVGPSQPEPLNHIQNAPDLRGKFLRGLNQMYSPGEPTGFDHVKNGDPDETLRKVGSYQGDGLIAHDHPASGHINGSVCGSNGTHDADSGHDKWNSDPTFGDHNVQVTVGNNSTGGKETRPKNIAVYYYIKIN